MSGGTKKKLEPSDSGEKIITIPKIFDIAAEWQATLLSCEQPKWRHSSTAAEMTLTRKILSSTKFFHFRK